MFVARTVSIYGSSINYSDQNKHKLEDIVYHQINETPCKSNKLGGEKMAELSISNAPAEAFCSPKNSDRIPH
jgi:hypothetical protein